MDKIEFSDEMVESLRNQQGELHFQVKVYYDEHGEIKEEMIPGRFRNPDDLHYGLDQFVELDVYDMLEDVIAQLGLSAEDQLRVVLAALNNLDMPSKYCGPAVRAEVVDLRDGSVVASVDER